MIHSPLLLHVHILSVSLRCAEDLGMVEQLLQTISRELSVVDVMGVFRGTHDTTRLVLSSYLHVSKPPHSPHSSHLPLTSSHTAPLTYHTPSIPTPTSPHLGSIEPLQQLQPALINFIREHCLNGAKPTPERKETAVETFLGGCIPAVTSIQVRWNSYLFCHSIPS